METNNTENTWTELKIIEPIENYIKEFKTPDEFNVWYSKHKNEVDAQTTYMLNKKYHIDGYRITKIKGVLMLKKWNGIKYYKRSDIQNDINEMKKTINSIIKFLNSSQQTILVSPPSTTSTSI